MHSILYISNFQAYHKAHLFKNTKRERERERSVERKRRMDRSNVKPDDNIENNSHILAASVGRGGGISVALSPETAQALRERQPVGSDLLQLSQSQPQLTVLGSKKKSNDNATEPTDEHVARKESAVDSNGINPLTEYSSNNKQSVNLKDEDSDLAMLPVVSISVERLVGYVPTGDEDLQSIREQLIEAMWAQSSFKNDTVGKTETKCLPPPDFDQHAEELFQNGMATFYVNRQSMPSQTSLAASTSDNPARSVLVIPYPPSLSRPSTIEEDNDDDDGNKNEISSSKQQSSLLDTVSLWQGLRRRAMRCSNAIDTDTDKSRKEVILSLPPHLPGGAMHKPISVRNAILHLFEHLQNCNRGLLWKHEMSLELQQMIYDEQTHKEYHQYHGQAAREQREQRISQLCTIRDALINQCHVQEAQVTQLQKDRDVRVTLDLQRQRQRQQVGGDFVSEMVGGLQSLDFDATTEMAFPDEFQLLKLDDSDDSSNDDRYYYDDDYDEDYRSPDGYEDEEDSENDDGRSGNNSDGCALNEEQKSGDDDGYEPQDGDDDREDDDENEKLKSIVDIDPARQNGTLDEVGGLLSNSRSRSDENGEDAAKVPSKFFFPSSSKSTKKQKQRRRRQKAQQRKQRQAAKEAAHQAKLDQAKEEERELKIKYTTNELTIALSKKNALERKLDQVEDLLESLHVEQEEEEADDLLGGETDKAESDETSGFSLLDQVLAMILGSLTPKPGMSQEDHFKYVQTEHAQIAYAWKDHFGRLPPAISSASSSGPAGPTDSADAFGATSMGTHNKGTVTKSKSMSVEEQRMALGLVGHDDWEDEAEDWDDGDVQSLDQVESAEPGVATVAPLSSLQSASTRRNNNSGTKEAHSLSSSSAKIVGLRPGSTAMRPS